MANATIGDHIATAFDNDLADIESLVMRMGGMVERQVQEAAEVLVARDGERAETVIARDPEIDRLEAELDQLTMRVIALRQPVAQDLRAVLAALKVAGNLERIGDYAKNMAKRTHVRLGGRDDRRRAGGLRGARPRAGGAGAPAR